LPLFPRNDYCFCFCIKPETHAQGHCAFFTAPQADWSVAFSALRGILCGDMTISQAGLLPGGLYTDGNTLEAVFGKTSLEVQEVKNYFKQLQEVETQRKITVAYGKLFVAVVR
jgi:hypothetical protein